MVPLGEREDDLSIPCSACQNFVIKEDGIAGKQFPKIHGSHQGGAAIAKGEGISRMSVGNGREIAPLKTGQFTDPSGLCLGAAVREKPAVN